MNKEELFSEMAPRLKKVMRSKDEIEAKLMEICEILFETVDYYDWVGFYMVSIEEEEELILGPYLGDPTEHTNIHFGMGICGQSAETKRMFVVQDVSQVSNYLSCNPTVKSEIVIPIFKDGEFAAELDIDSHTLAPFGKDDERFLEHLCKDIGKIL